MAPFSTLFPLTVLICSLVIFPTSTLASFICNGDSAQPASPFINANPPGSGSSSSSSSNPPPISAGGPNLGDLAYDAVNDVGFKKRQDVFECPDTSACLLDGGAITSSGQVINDGRLLCYSPSSGVSVYKDGYTLDMSTGDYETPIGEEGNLVEGPCPGSEYQSASDGVGCEPVTEESSPSSSTISLTSSPTAVSSSGAVSAVTATPSSDLTEATETRPASESTSTSTVNSSASLVRAESCMWLAAVVFLHGFSM